MANGTHTQNSLPLVLSDGCANNCNGQGQCVKRNDLWQCECNSSASGEFCEIPIETDCSDKIDNDNGK